MFLSAPQGLCRRPWRAPLALPPRRRVHCLVTRASDPAGPQEPTSNAANADVMARIKAARQYKDSQSSKPLAVEQPLPAGLQGASAAGSASSAAAFSGTAPPSKPQEGDKGGSSSAAADAVLARIKKAQEYKGTPEQQQQQQQQQSPAASGAGQQAPGLALPEQPAVGPVGSSQQAAGWLQTVVSKDQPEVTLRLPRGAAGLCLPPSQALAFLWCLMPRARRPALLTS
jgi:hypothetical protein